MAFTPAEEAVLKQIATKGPDVLNQADFNAQAAAVQLSPTAAPVIGAATESGGLLSFDARRGKVNYYTLTSSNDISEIDTAPFNQGDVVVLLYNATPATFTTGGNLLLQNNSFTLNASGHATAFILAGSSWAEQWHRGAILQVSQTEILEAAVVIPTAEVLTLNTTPVTLITAPGAGKYIEIISASAFIDFASVAYATNTNLHLRHPSNAAADWRAEALAFLAATSDHGNKMVVDDTTDTGTTQIIENEGIEVFVPTGDPTAGDSPLTVSALYRIVTI